MVVQGSFRSEFLISCPNINLPCVIPTVPFHLPANYLPTSSLSSPSLHLIVHSWNFRLGCI